MTYVAMFSVFAACFCGVIGIMDLRIGWDWWASAQLTLSVANILLALSILRGFS